MFFKAKTVAGLDIGSSSVKAVELRPSGKGYKVAAYGLAPLPPDSIVDGAIIDAGAVTAAIKQAFDSHPQFKARDVCASLSGNAVIVKKITLPVMSEAELAQTIHWEAEQHIPFDIEDVNLDFQIMESSGGGDSRGTMDVLLVAAKKDKIGDYTSAIAQAGRSPVIVDVDAFALQNAYEANYGDDTKGVVVLLNAGASVLNVNVLRDGKSIFTRDISIGGTAYTEALQKELDLSYEAAEQLKRGIPVDGATFEEALPILHAMNENVLLEIRKTFDFFKVAAESEHIDRIMLSGGASRVDRFREMVEERFGVPVEDFDPFKNVTCDAGLLPSDAGGVASAAVAVGLALRKVGDR